MFKISSLCLFMIPYFCHGLIDFSRIAFSHLETYPYQWTFIDQLFNQADGSDLAATYPLDHFKTVNGYDGEKGYVYDVRLLIPMGEKRIANETHLNHPWRELASDLLSDDYRMAMSRLTGLDLMNAPMEVNIFHYGEGAWMGPHVDLKDKIMTHVLYFNSEWDPEDGGCLAILRSQNFNDEAYRIPPVIGNSSVLVRSNHSWHAVIPISNQPKTSRRSMTVTFYHPNSISSMWPPGDHTRLHTYVPR